MVKQEIYFDNSATTPVLPEVADLAYRVMCEDWGNPAALYGRGLTAERLLKEARGRVAAAIGAAAEEIVFTSGGTEANNLALRGVMQSRAGRGRHLLISAVEHPAVLRTAEALREAGFEPELLPVDGQGLVVLAALREKLRPDTQLVSIMLVNNEVGAIQPIAQAAKIIRESGCGALLHTDAVQGFGKLPIDVGRLGVDLLSASGHKLHAPKGVGFLYVRRGLKFAPTLTGGGQESGWRSGTENMPGICALGLAAKLAQEQLTERARQAAAVRKRLLQGLAGLPDWQINGPANEGSALPNVLNISFGGVDRSEVLLHMLESDGLLVASGSACSNLHKDKLSHVLLAMGLAKSEIAGALRFSFSYLNTEAEAEQAAAIICKNVAELRNILR